MTIKVSNMLQKLYELSDRERFPSCLGDNEKRPSTLFYADFKVAEACGFDAVCSTMSNCGDLSKRDPYEVTELYMVLNHLMWEAYDRDDDKLMEYYKKWFDSIDDIVSEKWDDKAKEHFYSVSD